MAEFTTPADRPETNPLVTRLSITKGLIYKIHVYAPHGAMGLHYVQVFDGNYQVWPSTPGTSFRGDGFQVDFEDLYLKEAAPYELQVRSWNLDETYEHLCWIYVGMVSKEAFMMRFLPGMAQQEQQKMFEELTKQQEAEKAKVLAEGLQFVKPE